MKEWQKVGVTFAIVVAALMFHQAVTAPMIQKMKK